ncbi:6-methylsalicylate decarboxylase [Marchantia polymorpha subsp. ruderalis]|uniref:Amidohydrolase-related domain-containing protein n=2 Tax=Marchantia polymorpha TaxID=3197 RepID=A0AAF6B9Y0_MARPO|nr:hypothetical protein MARPO_0070s0012 [Marchantia polymorpha]BBN08814.1 hypothetical protein Mp_4g14690 [Marchantia polymorpha subsp. ruderalis]|eukprot:PTQ35538.1 hypothetical protein MARPO_0070s0012 [Marchantia polymorpha]
MAESIGTSNKETSGLKNFGSKFVLPVLLMVLGWKLAVIPFSSSSGPSIVEAGRYSREFASFRRIDTHAHFVPPFYFDTLKSMNLNAGGREVPRWNVSDHLQLMNRLKIETSILSVSTPGARLPGFDVLQARKLARELNEYAHMLTVTYPGRFQFFATLTLPDLEGSIDEAIYALDTLKAAGVVLLANSEGEYLGHKKFDPLMEVLNSRETTVFIHPNTVPGAATEGVPQFVIDFLLDTTRAAASLVLNNVTGRYPNLHWILAHSGGFMPFAGYRMGGALNVVTKESTESLLKELRTFYADTALSSSPSALPSTIAFLTYDHMTFGSDFPFAPNFVIEQETAQLDDFPLSLDKRHLINYENADRLFSKPLSHWRNVWSSPNAAHSS